MQKTGCHFQMLMNKGYYGGIQYLDPGIINLFTTRYQNSTRHGFGFDMKELNQEKSQLTSKYSSPATYGHTGFTGICVWNDLSRNWFTSFFLAGLFLPCTIACSVRIISGRVHQGYKAIEGYKGYAHELING
jgi:CubicO group peptidase (beta-lactamase class C family)